MFTRDQGGQAEGFGNESREGEEDRDGVSSQHKDANLLVVPIIVTLS